MKKRRKYRKLTQTERKREREREREGTCATWLGAIKAWLTDNGRSLLLNTKFKFKASNHTKRCN